MLCFPNSDHVMFSKDTYARGFTCIKQHLKDKILWGIIMLSEIGKQNKQAKKSIVFGCVQVLAARSRHSRGLAAKKCVSFAFSARCVNDSAGYAD